MKRTWPLWAFKVGLELMKGEIVFNLNKPAKWFCKICFVLSIFYNNLHASALWIWRSLLNIFFDKTQSFNLHKIILTQIINLNKFLILIKLEMILQKLSYFKYFPQFLSRKCIKNMTPIIKYLLTKYNITPD